MPETITKPEVEIPEFIRDRSRSASMMRMMVANRTAVDICYFQGRQWINTGSGVGETFDTSGRSLQVRYEASKGRLRVVQNETTKHVIAAASSTFPQAFDPQVDPPERDGGTEAIYTSNVCENALTALIRACRYTRRAQSSNYNRCISGVWGMGLCMKMGRKRLVVSGVEEEYGDGAIEAFDFHPMRLILDPAIASGDLRDHDEIVYEDVWTLPKLRRVFPGVQFDPADMSTVGELASNEIHMGKMTGIPMFQWYQQCADTKGARVYQVHIRRGGRYAEMYSCIERTKGSDIVVVNSENPQTPFGGDGLPLILLHGHQRPETWFSISDVSMIRDNQDKLNLVETEKFRIIRNISGSPIVVDGRQFARNVSDEDIANRITNESLGVLVTRPPPGDKSVHPPYIMQFPTVPPEMAGFSREYDSKMGEGVFRTQQSRGIGQKTHVTAEAEQLYKTEGDRVASIRSNMDMNAHCQLLSVLLGTIVKSVKQENPSVIGTLRREEFTDEDLMILAGLDENHPASRITLAEGTFRHRGASEKLSSLDTALQLQAISGPKYRRARAEFDTALDGEDNHVQQRINRYVIRIIHGEEWVPLPLGEYSEWFIVACQKAVLDRSVQFDPAAKQRLSAAIQAQQQVMLMDTAMQAQAEAGPQAATAQAAPVEPPAPTTVGELIAAAAQGQMVA